jgi:uncharacterized delta-60 repeat protein
MPGKTFTNKLARFISICFRMAGVFFLIFQSPNIWAVCDLDPTFGNAGLASTTIPNVNEVGAMLVLNNGKILQAARLSNGNNLDFAVAQFNADGSLDTTFGNGGIASANFPANLDDYATRPAVQSDGKIILVGFVFDGTLFDMAMVRFDANGNLDSTFGTGGFVQTDVGPTSGFIGDVAVLFNDNIILSGTTGSNPDFNMAAAKYDSNGNLDTTFGTNGIAIVDVISGGFDTANSLEIQADQKILLAGTADVQPSVQDFAMVRLNPDGTLDASFGSGGIVVMNSVVSLDDFINQTVVRPDGKILAVGTHQDGPDNDRTGTIALLRFNSDGTLDHTFGNGGFVKTDFPGFTFNTGWNVALRENGRIVIAASVETATASDFLLVEYNQDGSFCDTSLRAVNFPVDKLDSAGNVFVLPDGKILLGGSSKDPGGPQDFAMARFGCNNLDISPNALPVAQESISYNQNLNASGGTAPYTFSLESGILPTGILFDEPTATFSGTPAVGSSGDYSVNVQAVDNNGLIEDRCYVLKNTMLNEVFDDGVLNAGWTFTGTWQEANGFLMGGNASLKKPMKAAKSTALASPMFPGCAECRMRALVSTAGGIGNKISIIGWYQNKKKLVELIIKEEKNVVVLKTKGYSYPVKAKAKIEINPNQLYAVELELDDVADLHLRINGFDILSVHTVFVSGTFGYRVKQTVGTFGPLQID